MEIKWNQWVSSSENEWKWPTNDGRAMFMCGMAPPNADCFKSTDQT